jgi:hypothetical protein
MTLSCLCQRPFQLPDPWIVYGCPCGDIWRRGIDRYGYTVWRNRIGVTAKAMQLPKKTEDYTRAGESARTGPLPYRTDRVESQS